MWKMGRRVSPRLGTRHPPKPLDNSRCNNDTERIK